MTDAAPLRVAHIITKMAVGGAQESVLVTCRGIDRSRAEQWIVAGTEVDDEGSLGEQARSEGLRVVDCAHLRRSIHPIEELRAVRWLVRHLRDEQPDIVHTHSSKAGILGRIAARIARIPVVVHSVHGWSFTSEMSAVVRRAVTLVEAIAARWTTALVIEASPDFEKGRSQGIGRDDQYVLIRNGIDLTAFRSPAANPERIRAEIGLRPDQWVAGTVGRIADQKNPHLMIEAFAPLMKDDATIAFVWVGNGPLREEVAERIADLGLRDRFLLAGVRRDVPDVLGALDAFVLSSSWEGLPRTATEAMASGTPVIATAVDGLVELIDDGRNGRIVPPHDPVALADAVRSVRGSRAIATRLADGGRRRAAEFDQREMLRRLELLYAGLCAGRTPADVSRAFDEP